MRILLTGATGFVGRNFLLKLIAENQYEEIFVPVRNPEKLREQLAAEGVAPLPANVRIQKASAPGWDSLEWEAEHVVHAAGVLMAASYQEYESVNVEGTLRLLGKLRNPQKIIVLSSHAAAGPCAPDAPVKSERDRDEPVTWYGKSKLQMERQVARQYPQFPFLFLRPPMILGARDSASLPLFLLGKQPVQVKPGFREKLYSFIAVEDLVTALLAALADPGDWRSLPHRHFFVCAPEPISDRSLLEGAAATFQKSGRIVPVPHFVVRALSAVVGMVPAWSRKIPNLSPDRAKEIWPDRWVVSPEAFQNRFKWAAQRDLPSTLNATCDWYRQAGLL